MAKQLKPGPITADDLSEYLAKEDDFAFELEILQLCVSYPGFEIEHGGTYQDPATKKDRQFDLRLALVNPTTRCVLRLAVECKNLKANRPLLVSRVLRRADESYHEVIISRQSSPGNQVMGITPTQVVRVEDSLYRAQRMVGKSTAQIGRDNHGQLVSDDAEVYDKWTQALGSASHLVTSATRDYKVIQRDAAATVVLPVLVVPDETLWTVDYSEQGRKQAGPVRQCKCELYLGKHFAGSPSYAASHLLLFTKSEFGSYLGTVENSDWGRIFPNTIWR